MGFDLPLLPLWALPVMLQNMAIDAADLAPGWIPQDSLAMRLRALRHHMGLRVEEIAQLCDVALATWSSWENGARPRQLDEVVMRIATATKCDRDWLMWGREQEIRSSGRATAHDRSTTGAVARPRRS